MKPRRAAFVIDQLIKVIYWLETIPESEYFHLDNWTTCIFGEYARQKLGADIMSDYWDLFDGYFNPGLNSDTDEHNEDCYSIWSSVFMSCDDYNESVSRNDAIHKIQKEIERLRASCLNTTIAV